MADVDRAREVELREAALRAAESDSFLDDQPGELLPPPPAASRVPTQMLSARVSTALVGDARRLANALGVSLTDVVAAALADYVERKRQPTVQVWLDRVVAATPLTSLKMTYSEAAEMTGYVSSAPEPFALTSGDPAGYGRRS